MLGICLGRLETMTNNTAFRCGIPLRLKLYERRNFRNTFVSYALRSQDVQRIEMMKGVDRLRVILIKRMSRDSVPCPGDPLGSVEA